jgi:nickel/cobalt transporter (NicO) family protein
MTFRLRRYSILSLLSCLGALLLWLAAAPPTLAHWADMAAAEVIVEGAEVQMTLTFPTGLAPFADDDRNGQFSPDEVRSHQTELRDFLNEKIHLTDSDNLNGTLVVKPLEAGALPPTVQAAPNTHSTLLLVYSWLKPVQGIKIHYDLFLPGVPTANCLVTILQADQLQTVVFTPKNPSFAWINGELVPGLPGFANSGILLAIAGSFLWGAMHSMSPGHGKTIVGAYLVGSRATPQHALFLAATTTITHTIGVFALGLVTLFAAQYILPEQLYPWLSLLSGLMVMAIGLNLFLDRLKQRRGIWKLPLKVNPIRLTKSSSNYAFPQGRTDHHLHNHAHYFHDHGHRHSPDHPHSEHEGDRPDHIHTNHKDSAHHSTSHHHATHYPHSHDHHHSHLLAGHSHLPPGTDGSAVTWRELLALGISGGLIPCPAALVLLLSAIALGNTGFGLSMVLAFSLGLASVLTSLGLLMVYAKRFFQHVPTHVRLTKVLPAASALGITLIGLGISTKAVLQVMSF